MKTLVFSLIVIAIGVNGHFLNNYYQVAVSYLRKRDYVPLPRPVGPPYPPDTIQKVTAYLADVVSKEPLDTHRRLQMYGKPEPKPKPGPKPKPEPKEGAMPPKPKPKPEPVPIMYGDTINIEMPDESGIVHETKFVYPSNPFASPDYDILKAEVELLATRHSEQYMEAIYISLSNVRQQCYNDFESICVVYPSEPVDEISELQTVSFNPFQIFDVISSFLSLITSTDDVSTTTTTTNTNTPMMVDEATTSVRRLNSADSTHSDGEPDVWIWTDMFVEPNNGMTSDGSSGSESSSSSNGEPVQYMAPLGFGENGDICVYENYNSLSYSCQEAISIVYDLHNQYSEEEEEMHGPPRPMILLIGILLTLVIIRSCCRLCGPGAKRHAKMRAIMDAIRADPELKSRVEAASGETIPEPPKRCNGACCLRLIGAIAIVLIAVRITLCIATSLSNENEEPINGFAIFLLLLSITTILVVLLRLLKVCFMKCCSSNTSSSVRTSASKRVRSVYLWGQQLFQPSPVADGYVRLDANDDGSEMISRGYVQPIYCSGIPMNALPMKNHVVAGGAVPAQTYSNVTML
jgi:hypothetical protein